MNAPRKTKSKLDLEDLNKVLARLGPDAAKAAYSAWAAPTGAGAATGASGGLSAGLQSFGASGIGALLGMAPGLIAKGLGVDPKTGMIIDAATQLAAPPAAAAAAGALGLGAGAAAGGGLAGAGASLSASAPTLAVTLPITAMYMSQLLDYQLGKAEAAEKTQKKLGQLTGGIEGSIADWNRAPGLLRQLNNASPEEAQRVLGELQAIQSRFQASGMEDFLKRGVTSSRSGPAEYAQGFPEGPAIMERLKPQMSAYDVGLLRAADIMARGGMDISANPYADPRSAAVAFGADYSWLRPPGDTRTNPEGDPSVNIDDINPLSKNVKYAPYLTENYADARAFRVVDELMAANPEWSRGQAEAAFPLTPPPFGDVEDSYQAIPSPWFFGSATNPRAWSSEANQALTGLQPGNYEKGLADLLGVQNLSPHFQGWGFGTGTAPGGEVVSGGEAVPIPEGTAAGKRLPLNLVTGASGTPKPEVENAQEAAEAGKRQGGMRVSEGGAAGAPFGGPVRPGFGLGRDFGGPAGGNQQQMAARQRQRGTV